MTITPEEERRAVNISHAIQEHLEQTRKVNVHSTDLYDVLSQRGLIPRDNSRGLHFRHFLRKLLDARKLDFLIPQCQPTKRSNGQYDWTFNSKPGQRKLMRVAVAKPKAAVVPGAPSRKLAAEAFDALRARVCLLPKDIKPDATHFERSQRALYPRAHTPWHVEERALLWEVYTKYTSNYPEMCRLFERSEGSLSSILIELREAPPPMEASGLGYSYSASVRNDEVDPELPPPHGHSVDQVASSSYPIPPDPQELDGTVGLEERIKASLEALDGIQNGRGPWTELVKCAFIATGSALGYNICCALSEKAHKDLPDVQRCQLKWGEWLYDLVWYTSVVDERTGVERTLSIPLVVECEWDASLHSLGLDFDKLLIANADLRVLVCSAYSAFPKEEIIGFCKRAVNGYAQGRHGDKFLVCVFHPSDSLHCQEIIKGVNDF